MKFFTAEPRRRGAGIFYREARKPGREFVGTELICCRFLASWIPVNFVRSAPPFLRGSLRIWLRLGHAKFICG